MLEKMTQRLDFHASALLVRAERQRAIASNIANADTPGYVARDVNFGAAMREAAQAGATLQPSGAPFTAPAHAQHMALPTVRLGAIGSEKTLGYAAQTQPSLDNNTVDLDRERANFVDNAVRYEATLRFINGQSKTLLSAIQGQ